MKKQLIYIIFLSLGVHSAFGQAFDTTQIKETINKFLSSIQPEKEKFYNEIISKNPDFDFTYKQLNLGKTYSSSVAKGFFEKNYINEQGIEHPNLVFIPYDYDPQKKYQIRVFLHGAVSSLNSRQLIGQINRKDTAWLTMKTINIYPAAWAFSKWWSFDQYENISTLLTFVKENYNIDENHVYLTGISDGGTGVYYFSNFYQTPFSCYIPIIGSMETFLYQTNKQIYMDNYQGQSYYIVNGRKDEIFDINFIVPTINALKKVAQEVKFTIVDTSAHNLRWFPVLKDSIKNYADSHKRNPFPDLIKYSTEKPDTFCRKFWVKITKIGLKKGEINEELNTTIQNGREVQLFPRKRLFGQIEVYKNENTVYVKTNNIIKYSLLLSPKHFDLNAPIEIYTNGILSFKGFASKNINTLLKYYIEDIDREMLFASELEVKVGKKYKVE